MEVDKATGKVVNDKGQTYFYHEKENVAKPYLKTRYFSKAPEGAKAIPDGMDVIANPRTGLPMVKKHI